MNLLLDTHTLLWWLADEPTLSRAAWTAISDTQNTVSVSSVSIWEIAIKRKLGKLEIADEWFAAVCEESFQRLSISWEHTSHVEQLPDLHRDPFDRMLIAQARVEGLTLITRDANIRRYDVSTLEA